MGITVRTILESINTINQQLKLSTDQKEIAILRGRLEMLKISLDIMTKRERSLLSRLKRRLYK